ncbi:MAG: AMP-binding protein, partial [Alphaproteobacteria bacterium]|nr:AMP-binding protein [Alphaproteobacteria bacterium]
MSWNFSAAIGALCAQMPPGTPALIYGDQTTTYDALGRRTDALAAAFEDKGLPRGKHVGHMMRTHPPYLETAIAAGKAGLTHVNINYRYQAEELKHLFDTLDISVVVYDAEFADRIKALRDMGVPLDLCIEVGEGEDDFADSYEELIAAHVGKAPSREPSDDDLIIIATGGTTGMPKGVMWRQEDMWHVLKADGNFMGSLDNPPKAETLDDHVKNVLEHGPRLRFCTLAPYMHGTGLMTAMLTLAQG